VDAGLVEIAAGPSPRQRISLWPTSFDVAWNSASTMTYTLEISDELKERMERHLEEDETMEEFVEELVAVYETEGSFLREGYSE
jgi:hypothetical protein